MVVGAFGGRTSSGYLLQGSSSEPQPHCHSHKREFRRGPPSRTSMLDDLVRFEDTNKHQQELAISTNTFLNSALLVVQKYYTAPHQHVVPSRGIS